MKKNKLKKWNEIKLTNVNKNGLSALWYDELQGQKVFYKYMYQKKITGIEWKTLFNSQSDGIVRSVLFEHKLDEKSGGGLESAHFELFTSIPKRIKESGRFLPFYRIYIELETFLAEIYDKDCNLIDSFDWFEKPKKFQTYIDSGKFEEYDLTDKDVNIVEVIQNMYDIYLGLDSKGNSIWKNGHGYIRARDKEGKVNLNSKKEAMDLLQKGIPGWFKPLDFKKTDINLLIKNNDKMNEKYVQKLQGAFFTPPHYVRFSTEMVNNAITQSRKEGYDDYVIIDRCAGVGNLQSQFTHENEKHMILGTINEAEASILELCDISCC